MKAGSLPIRGAWIEILLMVSRMRSARSSLPLRVAWIEILECLSVDFGLASRSLFLVKSVFRVGAGAVLLDSSLIPSPPIMPQDRARVDDP